MLVALTNRHFRDLAELTGTTKAVAAVAEALGADFTDEGQRYEHRAVLTGLFAPWFARHTADEVTAALAASSLLWDRYLDFAEVARHPRVTENPLFSLLEQPPASAAISRRDCRCRWTGSTSVRSPPPHSVTTPRRCWPSSG